jgi:hypothetical protein
MSNEVVGIDPVPEDNRRWVVAIDGDELTHLQTRYQDRVDEDEWETVRDTAAKLLAHCPDPRSEPSQTTGLALGKVQSGKTLSYTSLIALGMDNGYRMSIVLAGTKNPLLKQNFDRLCYDLETTRPSVTPIQNPTPLDGVVIRSVIEAGGHALLVVLKNRRRIDELVATLAAEDLSNYPTLLIDDEGDEASLNTQFRRGRESAVYASILRLRARLRFHAYVAYTATPQANLLISGIDGLSPDFGILIPPGTAYCGGSVFFGARQHDFIRTVRTQDAAPHEATRITQSLREALAAFVVGAAVRHLRENAAWHSMLVHTSQLRADHELLQRTIRELISSWRDISRLTPQDPTHQELFQLFQGAYRDLQATVGMDPSWEEVTARVSAELGAIEVWMVNSLPFGRDPIATPFRLMNNILVGGNMLGRGVTIHGLAVTYITRRAQNDTNADTMEQRARWFGYKQQYLDLCRIYLTQQLRTDYTALLRHEDDFWDALRRNERQGLSIRDWPRMFALDLTLGVAPTRSSVANFRQFRGRKWDTQNQLTREEVRANANTQATRRFLAGLTGERRRFANVEHTFYECPTDQLATGLLSRFDPEGSDWENAYTCEYLSRLFLSGRLPTVEVVAMTSGELRERTPNRETGRVNPMQGRSPNRRPDDPLFYPGDENIHADRVQFQIHFIRLTDDGTQTTAFALHVPEDGRYDLRYVVRDPN